MSIYIYVYMDIDPRGLRVKGLARAYRSIPCMGLGEKGLINQGSAFILV